MTDNPCNVHPSKVWDDTLDWDNAIIPLRLSEAEAFYLLEHFDVQLKLYRTYEFSVTRTTIERLRERLAGIIDPGRAPIVSVQVQEEDASSTTEQQGSGAQEDVTEGATRTIEEPQAGSSSSGETPPSDQTAT